MKTKDWLILLLGAALVVVSVRLATSSSSGSDSDNNSPDSTALAQENASMDALECIMTRTSVREYADKPVPDSIVEKILRAGMAAPSAVNKQPWQLVVIDNSAIKDSISQTMKNAKMVAKSPLTIAVCGNMDLVFDGDTKVRGNWVLDCSAVSENILLAAHAMGLGAVWCGIYPVDQRVETISRLLYLPDNIVPLSIIAIGYPNAATTPKQKWDPEKVTYIK